MKQPILLTPQIFEELKSIRGVCLDIDDTLSSRGKLTSPAFEALWRLKQKGFTVVPVTGRPAGWCDHIARFWPVDAVVGENGAFTFYMDGGVRRRIDTLPDAGTIEVRRLRLEKLGSEIRSRFPHACWASDQAYREYDLAIDICEDVEPWKVQDVEALLGLCRKAGAHAKLSSIHVNTWFGDYDKRSGFKVFSESTAGQNILGGLRAQEWLYVGDSPNDEPMFEVFKTSVGVANLKKYLKTLIHPPSYLTSSESGDGFKELVDGLIRVHG